MDVRKRLDIKGSALVKSTTIVILSLSLYVFAYPADSEVGDKGNIKKLVTAETAITKADAYMGFNVVSEFSSTGNQTARLAEKSRDNTPFTSKMITTRSTWQITYPDVKIDLWGAVDKRDFHVILDPETGSILSVFSVSDNAGSSDTFPEPSAEAAEKYLGSWTFNGIPDEAPPISFSEILKNCPTNPATVKSIRAMYISYSRGGHDYPAVWLIIMRGIENPLPLSGRGGEDVPKRFYNSEMILMDAKSGAFMSFQTAPYDREQIREYNKRNR